MINGQQEDCADWYFKCQGVFFRLQVIFSMFTHITTNYQSLCIVYGALSTSKTWLTYSQHYTQVPPVHTNRQSTADSLQSCQKLHEDIAAFYGSALNEMLTNLAWSVSMLPFTNEHLNQGASEVAGNTKVSGHNLTDDRKSHQFTKVLSTPSNSGESNLLQNKTSGDHISY